MVQNMQYEITAPGRILARKQVWYRKLSGTWELWHEKTSDPPAEADCNMKVKTKWGWPLELQHVLSASLKISYCVAEHGMWLFRDAHFQWVPMTRPSLHVADQCAITKGLAESFFNNALRSSNNNKFVKSGENRKHIEVLLTLWKHCHISAALHRGDKDLSQDVKLRFDVAYIVNQQQLSQLGVDAKYGGKKTWHVYVLKVEAGTVTSGNSAVKLSWWKGNGVEQLLYVFGGMEGFLPNSEPAAASSAAAAADRAIV